MTINILKRVIFASIGIGLFGIGSVTLAESQNPSISTEELNTLGTRLQQLIDHVPKKVDNQFDSKQSKIDDLNLQTFYDTNSFKQIPPGLDAKLFSSKKPKPGFDYLHELADELKKYNYELSRIIDDDSFSRPLLICPNKLAAKYHKKLEALIQTIKDDSVSAEAFHLLVDIYPHYGFTDSQMKYPQSPLYQIWSRFETHPTAQPSKVLEAKKKKALTEFKNNWNSESTDSSRTQKLKSMAQQLVDLNSLAKILSNHCPSIEIRTSSSVRIEKNPRAKKFLLALDLKQRLSSRGPFESDYLPEDSPASKKFLHFDLDLSDCYADLENFCKKRLGWEYFESEGVSDDRGTLDCLEIKKTRLQPKCKTALNKLIQMEGEEYNLRGIKLNLTEQRFVPATVLPEADPIDHAQQK